MIKEAELNPGQQMLNIYGKAHSKAFATCYIFPGHFYSITDNSLTAMGIVLDLTVLPSNGQLPKATYRTDGQQVASELMKVLPWETGYPILTDPLAVCVAFANGSVINTPCHGYYEGLRFQVLINTSDIIRHIYLKLGTNITLGYLGYICEARPSQTIDPAKSCVFPFTHDGIVHDSCSHDYTAPGLSVKMLLLNQTLL